MYRHQVSKADIAAFHGQTIHEVYATFAIARDAEWCSRLFALDMKEDFEEGIGTFVHIQHHAPAFVGETVEFTATIVLMQDNALECTITAKVQERLIATGSTGQKIVAKEKLQQRFDTIRNAT